MVGAFMVGIAEELSLNGGEQDLVLSWKYL